MSHRYLAALLLPLLPLAARAQSNFQPGYVVRPAGDTLRGEVDLRDSYFNATQCRFRPALNAEVSTYTPAELRAYALPAKNLIYRSLVLPEGGQPVFAQVLVGGPATLYTVRDADRRDRYYLEAPQFALAELASRRLLLPDGSDYQEQPTYRLTLAQALPNCPAVEQQLAQLPLSALALSRVVRAFNACRGVVAVNRPAPNRSPPHLGVLAGGQFIAMHLSYPSGSQGQGTTTVALPTLKAPVLGVSLSLPLGALSRKLSVELGLLYAWQRYDFSLGSITTLGTERQDFSFSQRWVRLPVLLRFSPLPQAAVRPVLEAGIGLAYATTLDATVTTTDYLQRTATKPFFDGDRRNFQEALVLGAGVQANYWQSRRATALFRFEADNGWTAGQGIDTSANRYYLLLALDLTK